MEKALEDPKALQVGTTVATRILESDGIIRESVVQEPEKEFKVTWGKLGDKDSVHTTSSTGGDSGGQSQVQGSGGGEKVREDGVGS